MTLPRLPSFAWTAAVVPPTDEGRRSARHRSGRRIAQAPAGRVAPALERPRGRYEHRGPAAGAARDLCRTARANTGIPAAPARLAGDHRLGPDQPGVR